jgi:CPA1 family monovalent cation:H+ antiporter
VRWARLTPDPSEDEERRLGESTALEAALESLPSLAAELGVDDEIAERVRAEYEEHQLLLEAEEDERHGESTLERDRQATELRLALLERKRKAVLDLRDEGRIDDIVLRDLQRRIDVEEVRLSGAEPGA